MRIVGSPNELVDPKNVAACYVDRHFLVWGSRLGVGGHAVWGHPTGADADALTHAFEVVLARPELHPRIVVADFRALAAVELDAFRKVREYVKRHGAEIERLVEREAVLRPDGIAGTVVAGFYAVVPGPIETRTFVDLERAIRWIDRRGAGALLREVDRIAASAPARPTSSIACGRSSRAIRRWRRWRTPRARSAPRLAPRSATSARPARRSATSATARASPARRSCSPPTPSSRRWRSSSVSRRRSTSRRGSRARPA